ncbi:MAG: hypothetical protein K0R09_2970 [Clostridiales bacterium]|jgi:hypothetical protein|nr:hypothetical protein [Clostridiales bacterium]
MDSNLSIRFFKKIYALEDREYLLSIIKFHTAPTLEGNKPSSLINLTKDRRDLYSLWNINKDEISGILKIDYFEIQKDSKRKLILLYNPYILEETINRPENKKYLEGLGYVGITSIVDTLEILRSRFAWTFPHEIGIFLGIPYEDVDGFIKNSGRNFMINGYWKVYSKPQMAMKTFREYDYTRTCVIKSIMKEI